MEHTGVANVQKLGVTALEFSPDGITIVSGNSEGAVKFWSSARGERLAELPAMDGPVNYVKFSSDGTRLGVMQDLPVKDSDHPLKVFKIWSTNSGQQLGLFSAHKSPITLIKFSPDGTPDRRSG